MTVASVAYDRARLDVDRSELDAAISALGVAAAFDPSMALYARTLGAVRYVAGDEAAAIHDLERATSHNPSDDLGWRTLALARLADGDDDGAEAALRRAVERQRSDATNLLLASRLAGDDGRVDDAVATLAEVLQAWPATAFAVDWPNVLPVSTPTQEVLDRAIERWQEGAPMPELARDQSLWLTLMADRADLVEVASAESGWSPAIDETLGLVMRCEDATDAFDVMDPAEQRSYFYWWLQVADAKRQGSADDHAARMAGFMGHTVDESAADTTLNPLNENGQFSADAWGYRRGRIVWPESPDDLPSSSGGMMRWMYRAADAVESATLGTELPACLATAP